MPITATQITSGQTLEEFRRQYNLLVQDVTDMSDNHVFTSNIKFEGSSADDYETTLAVTNPTADRTITLPDESGSMLTTASSLNATTATVTSNNSADETVYPVFVDSINGTLGLESDTGLTYNPSSGILTATQFTGALSGNATTATALASGRTIGMTGDVTWTSASFDGSGNVTGTAAIGTGVIVNDDINASAAIAMSKTALVAGTGITLSTNTLNVDAAQTGITSVGALDGGSITSGFGTIDTGSSTITTTGAISGGSFVVANDGNIGSASDTDALAISAGGAVTFSQRSVHSGGITIANAGQIGSASDTDAMAISSGGVVTFTQIPVMSAGLNVSGGSIAGTLSTAAQTNITSVGALDGGSITSNFGTINTGSSNITTSGTVTGGTLAGTLSTAAQTNVTSVGTLTGLVIADAGNIGSASDTDAIAISSGGVVTLSQRPVLSGGLTIADGAQIGTASDADAITLDATGVATFSQRPVIGTGGLTIPNDGQIGSAGDTDAISINSSGNVTMSQDLTITGNLTVNGSTVTNSASNTVIEDYLIELNNGAGSNANDMGFIMERGSTGDNAFMGWDESADKFVFGTTTATGASSGNLSISNGTIVAANVEGTLTTAAQTNITSVGTLSGLAIANGGNIGSASDTDAMSIASGGAVTFSQRDIHSAGITVADAGQIGSASDADSMAIAADGVVTFTQIPVMSAGLNVSGGTIAGTLATAAQTNITSVGALDGGSITSNFGTINTGSSTITTTGAISGGSFVVANGANIGSTGDTDAIAIASDGVVTMNQIPVFSAGINVSGGSIAGTLSTAAQGNITSLGTLTSLTVDNIIVNGTNIGHTSDTDAIAIASDGKTTFSQQTTHSGGIVIADAGNIGSASDTDAIAIASDGTTTFSSDVIISDTSAASTVGPELTLYRNSSSPADSDGLGQINFKGRNDNSQDYRYARIYSVINDASDTSEDGGLNIAISSGGSGEDIWRFGAAAAGQKFITIPAGGGFGTTGSMNSITMASGGVVTFADRDIHSAGITVANDGQIGSVGDTDALSIASDGKISLTQDLYLSGSQKELRFYEGSNYVGFKAPSLSGNQIWVLPDGDASSNGDALVSDGSGNLTFSSVVGSNASSVTLADESSDTSCFVMFATAATGNQNPKTGSNLTFNSSSGLLTATGFSGNLTGTLQTAAQTNVTSLGTLTALTVDNITIDGTNIGHTSDTDAISIASDGKVTFSQNTTTTNLIIGDAGTIGSASDTDAIAIGADGDVTLTQDLELQHDGAVLSFGGNDEITLTHVHDTGLALKHTATADDKPIVLTLQTGETDIAADDVIGKIDFQAPDEGAGTDAITVAASISAVSEGDFSASNNATKIEFSTGLSEVASAAMSLSSTGALSFPNKQGGDNLLLDSTNGTADAGDDVILNGTDGSSTNADSNIIFEDAVALTTQTDRHIMKRMMGEFNSEQEDLFPNKLRLIKSDGTILKTYHCAGDA